MKVTITVEQFDNGIAIVDIDEGAVKKLVSLERNQLEAIGSVIWGHVKETMDSGPVNMVSMSIEFQPA